MHNYELIAEILTEPALAIPYRVSQRLAELYPDCALVEGSDCDFTLQDFASAGLCSLVPNEIVHNQFRTGWIDGRGVQTRGRNVWYEVCWQTHTLYVLLIDLGDAWGEHFWILTEDQGVATAFFESVCAFTTEVEGEVLVFESGYWQADTR